MSERLPCELAMGLIRGREIQELVEDATGEPCPCREGKGCPLSADTPRLHIPQARYSAAGVLLTFGVIFDLLPPSVIAALGGG